MAKEVRAMCSMTIPHNPSQAMKVPIIYIDMCFVYGTDTYIHRHVFLAYGTNAYLHYDTPLA